MKPSSNLRYGLQAQLDLPCSPDQDAEIFSEPIGASCEDPAAAVRAALISPLQHPSLAAAVVPGDRVVIAVGQPIPESANVLAGIVQSLDQAGVDSRNILILIGSATVTDEQWKEIRQSELMGVEVERHDARDRMSAAYLASTAAGQPIYMNRHLCDADFVISVGCIHPQRSPGYLGLFGSLYPAFADLESIRRFYRQSGKKGHKLRRHECEEVGWLLGARFTTQIIPGAGDQILQILAGDIDAVAEEGLRIAKQAWSWSVKRQADLVVTAIQGGPAQQTWQNLYRSLEAAGQVLDNDGNAAILACTELEAAIDDQVLHALIPQEPYGETADGTTLNDLQPARLIPALEGVRVYLLSRLASELVEDLGMIPVSDVDEVRRICSRSERRIVLSNGQHVWPELKDAELVR